MKLPAFIKILFTKRTLDFLAGMSRQRVINQEKRAHWAKNPTGWSLTVRLRTIDQMTCCLCHFVLLCREDILRAFSVDCSNETRDAAARSETLMKQSLKKFTESLEELKTTRLQDVQQQLDALEAESATTLAQILSSSRARAEKAAKERNNKFREAKAEMGRLLQESAQRRDAARRQQVDDFQSRMATQREAALRDQLARGKLDFQKALQRLETAKQRALDSKIKAVKAEFGADLQNGILGELLASQILQLEQATIGREQEASLAALQEELARQHTEVLEQENLLMQQLAELMHKHLITLADVDEERAQVSTAPPVPDAKILQEIHAVQTKTSEATAQATRLEEEKRRLLDVAVREGNLVKKRVAMKEAMLDRFNNERSSIIAKAGACYEEEKARQHEAIQELKGKLE
jgi:hypothetical protein